ncbi:MAG: 2-amino-4-oxopentanoate thiolase subunit OrtA [Chloroflexota bacterium]
MAELINAGTWVEIHSIVLPAGQRAPQIPEDTKGVPLEMRVKGFLVADARVGDRVEIVTIAGRRLRGVLVGANPAYAHGFGPPIPELLTIGAEVRAVLRAAGKMK